MKRTLARGALPATAVGLVLSVAACSSGSSPAAGSSSPGSPSSSSGSSSVAAAGAAVAGSRTPFGPGCGQLPASGSGSLEAMGAAPVATAASSDPALSTLVQAVTKASLVDTLNTTGNITVFAPANSAFQAVPADQLNALLADTARLTAVLTHHIVSGRLTPDRLAAQLTTLNNDRVTVQGSGQNVTISGDQTLSGQPAHVVCGNVQTANATVYIIDQVLKPQG
ncbi:MAG: Secreted/surface protein with fasciclin-like repeat [Frankiales bacterium]|nr:Secreted/surface protein with fasciclin-like repeat [Frankiales bacterium]